MCGALVEDVKHYFLFCPSFAALRETLFSGAHLLGNKWVLVSDKKRIEFVLNGVPGLDDFQINVNLCSSVQSFISNQIVFRNYVLFV